MQYREMSDEMLKVAHMTWEHMAMNEIEFINSHEGISNASQESLNAFGWYMHNYQVIMDEFRERTASKLKFSKEDVFLAVGQADRSGIFRFYPGSAAYQQYGEQTQGKIIYKKRERDMLEQAVQLNPMPRTDGVICLTSHTYNDSKENIEALKEQGFSAKDIMELLNFSFDDSTPSYTKEGIKEIPNTINIKVDLSGIDPVISYVRLTEDLMRMAEPLIEHDLVKYYAYQYILNPESITPEIEAKYLVDGTTGEFTSHVLLTILDARLERGPDLSDEELQQYQSLKNKLTQERLHTILNGLGVSKKTYAKLHKSHKEVFYGIYSILINFETETISGLENKHPVYWDFDRFSHIIIRHYEGLKIAESTYFSKPNQTPSAFQYTYRDVVRLVKIIVKHLATEIDAKLSKGESFAMFGDQGYYYNGNYYAIRIASDGRLMQFHPID